MTGRIIGLANNTSRFNTVTGQIESTLFLQLRKTRRDIHETVEKGSRPYQHRRLAEKLQQIWFSPFVQGLNNFIQQFLPEYGIDAHKDLRLKAINERVDLFCKLDQLIEEKRYENGVQEIDKLIQDNAIDEEFLFYGALFRWLTLPDKRQAIISAKLREDENEDESKLMTNSLSSRIEEAESFCNKIIERSMNSDNLILPSTTSMAYELKAILELEKQTPNHQLALETLNHSLNAFPDAGEISILPTLPCLNKRISQVTEIINKSQQIN